jgi:hypothetical protein
MNFRIFQGNCFPFLVIHEIHINSLRQLTFVSTASWIIQKCQIGWWFQSFSCHHTFGILWTIGKMNTFEYIWVSSAASLESKTSNLRTSRGLLLREIAEAIWRPSASSRCTGRVIQRCYVAGRPKLLGQQPTLFWHHGIQWITITWYWETMGKCSWVFHIYMAIAVLSVVYCRGHPHSGHITRPLKWDFVAQVSYNFNSWMVAWQSWINCFGLGEIDRKQFFFWSNLELRGFLGDFPFIQFWDWFGVFTRFPKWFYHVLSI